MMIAMQGDTPYYTGSTELPIDGNVDLFTRLDIQNRMQEIYTGGTIFNVRLAKNEYDAKGIAVLLERIMENYTIPYITLNTCNRDYPIEGYLYQEAVNER